MATRLFLNSFALLLISSLCLKATAESSGSVVFLEGPSGKYLRNQDGERRPILSSEIAGAVSILLGISPSSSFSPDSSSKLNEVLTPNPFYRPHAVFFVQVDGLDDMKIKAGNVLKDNVVGASKAEIQLPGDDVLVTRVDESLDSECNSACLDDQLTNLANFLDGSYSDGKLSLPLSSGASLDLHLSKEAELEFAVSLSQLVRGVKRAVQFHQDLSNAVIKPSELITGHFTAFKGLEEKYTENANEIFETTLSKLFDLLHQSYEGEIVGVIVSNKEAATNKIEMTSSPKMMMSLRFLEETSSSSDNSTIAEKEVKLVRKTLAWITGIILLVSTIMGVCMLMNMPITRDTLLYSNVKLD
ncbi:hypothetical protein LUZ60_012251 [Juncus effusus]|nr:hypothetical protein LUZ60_012251 [Juncus effusus]